MKKFLKVIGLLLGLVVLIFFVLAFTQPKDVTIVRKRTIKAKHDPVFQQVIKFKNWVHWSPWIEQEPSVRLNYFGVDGQPGSGYEWAGDETGSGKMTNTGITAEQMNIAVEFLKPWKGAANGFLKVEAQKTGDVEVTWSLTTHAKFPMNALNIFSDKMIGGAFERGLENLAEYVAAHPNVELSETSIIEKSAAAARYACMRKTISWSQMTQFSKQAFEAIKTAVPDRIVGSPCTFYFNWNDSAQTTELAPAYKLSGDAPVADKRISILDVPNCIAYSLLYKGGYAGLGNAHRILGNYLAQKGTKLRYVMEEYIYGPANEADSTKWTTEVTFFVN